MSKRFGRNQRRKLREAAARAELRAEALQERFRRADHEATRLRAMIRRWDREVQRLLGPYSSYRFEVAGLAIRENPHHIRQLPRSLSMREGMVTRDGMVELEELMMVNVSAIELVCERHPMDVGLYLRARIEGNDRRCNKTAAYVVSDTQLCKYGLGYPEIEYMANRIAAELAHHLNRELLGTDHGKEDRSGNRPVGAETGR